jgi:uncharacterized repeat protein (TIGR01451 family)
MNNLFTAIKRSPKRVAAIAVVAAAVLVPAALFAWGPDRPTYTQANPADHVTFNSITDNQVVGDERQFVGVKDASDTSSGNWQKAITVTGDKDYLVRVYIHNNAASNLNDAAHNYKGVAINTRVSASIPTTTGKNVTISGFVSADNAQPQKVWADASFSGATDFNVGYVAGSARVYNNGYASGGQGQALPDSIVTSAGALLGYDAPDGKVPGCFQYVNYVTFKVHVSTAKTPNFTVEKQVSPSGKNTYSKSVATQPGDLVDYKIQYKNTGETPQDNVVIKDQLPAGVAYVPGSTYISNSKTNSQWQKVTEDTVTTTGINIGSYNPGGNAYVKFTAKVTDNSQLKDCGMNTLVNTATAQTANGNKSDTANVVVSKTCQPGTISVCEISTGNIVTINEDQFDSSKYSKNLEDCAKCTIPGKENLPANSPECKTEMCTVPGKESLPKNSPECVAPVSELPTTGIDSGLATFAGIGILTAGAGYALTSSRIRKLLIG